MEVMRGGFSLMDFIKLDQNFNIVGNEIKPVALDIGVDARIVSISSLNKRNKTSRWAYC